MVKLANISGREAVKAFVNPKGNPDGKHRGLPFYPSHKASEG